MKRWILFCSLFAFGLSVYFVVILMNQAQVVTAASDPTPAPPEKVEEITDAIFESLSNRREALPAAAINDTRVDNVAVSGSDKWATAWLVPQDASTGADVPTEPGLAILRRQGDSWDVAMPGDLRWESWLESAPEDMFPEGEREYWMMINARYAAAIPSAPVGGYLLPWEGGLQGNLTGSLVHDSYIPSCNSHYGFDFTITNPSTGRGGLFEIHAAKAGTVWKFRDDLPTGSTTTPGNYMVIQDTTTTPTTYVLYLHLAQSSIPAQFKQFGVYVQQGDIIGVADDTGASSGHHLHFHVHTAPDSYWGRAVDITFDDVDINGGRPRMRFIPGNQSWDDFLYCNNWCGFDDICQGYRSHYISGNTGRTDFGMPTGELTAPEIGTEATAHTVTLQGTATDAESGLRSVQLMASYSGAWHEIGPALTAMPFSYEWDMCQSGTPDGLIAVAMRITDNQNNVANEVGQRYISKSFACASELPPCTPGPQEVALYTKPDYGGSCVRFGVGEYPLNLNLVGMAEQTASLQVGSEAMVTMFADENFSGRAETFISDVSNLQGNLVGTGALSSLKVMLRGSPPQVPNSLWPNAININQFDSLSLYWENEGETLEYQARLSTPAGLYYTSSWSTEPFWLLGNGLDGVSFVSGAYLWDVRARNATGVSDWSIPYFFMVQDDNTSAPATVSAPFTDDFETENDDWRSSGLWHRSTAPVTSHSGSYYWWFGADDAGNMNYFSAKSGDLTSQPIVIPSAPTYYLRFWYRYQTEGDGTFWDQRWVQISMDGGPFQNVHQLFGEVMLPSNPPENYLNTWLQSPALDLSAYAGHTIRVRFNFDTVDPSGTRSDNDFEGWFIDDMSITSTAPVVCADAGEPNNLPTQATELGVAPAQIKSVICPNGDKDYYSFTGQVGDWVTIDVTAKPTSSLDSYMYLLDVDGTSVLAENDDQVFLVNLDSYIEYRLRRSGTYYIKIRPWSYPKTGGSNYFYTIDFSKDSTPQGISLLSPVDNGYLDLGTARLQASVDESASGIQKVEFFWHSDDWSILEWTSLGMGVRDGSQWVLDINPAMFVGMQKMAFYVEMTDNSGNVVGDVSWNVSLDQVAPTTALSPLDAQQDSTAFLLTWTAADMGVGLSSYEIQHSIDSQAWADWQTLTTPAITQLWYVGEPGSVVSFRMRGNDLAGNVEDYPFDPEVTTTIPAVEILCATLDAADLVGSDNTFALAQPLALGTSPQEHNFCNPLKIDFKDDEDWVWFDVEAGQTYLIQALPKTPDTSIALYLYAEDSSTLLTQNANGHYGQTSALWWTAQNSGKVYLQARHPNGSVLGSSVSYSLQAMTAIVNNVYLPLLQR